MAVVSRIIFEEWYTKEYSACKEKPIFGSLRNEIKKFLEILPLSCRIVLDVGCGDGRNSIAMAKRGLSVTGLDIVPSNIIKQKAIYNEVSINYIRKNVMLYDEPTNYYDVVVCSEMLHLLTKDEVYLVLEKIKNTTNKGGYVFVDILSDIKRWFEPNHEIFTWDKEASISISGAEIMLKNIFRSWNIIVIDNFFDKQTWPVTNSIDLPISKYTWEGTYVSCVAMKI